MPGLKYSYDVLIREHHLDSFGHVNNAVYLELYEEARWEYITSRGYGYREVHDRKVGPVILGIQLKFRKELTLREKITITGQTTSYDRLIGNIHQEMINGKGEICSAADFTFGLFDMKARKLIAPTPEWLHAIGWTAW